MKLKLSISQRVVNSISGPKEQFLFAVVDLDRSEGYPENFVCLLPKKLDSRSKLKSRFLEIFGENSNQVATNLLVDALRSEADIDVKREIEKRLKSLEPRKPIIANCVLCGCSFESKRVGRFLQRVCENCRSKHKPS
jgi:hypothetical protein